MAHRALSKCLIAAVGLALACESERTAIVLEATSETSEALDQVIFRVSGPGLDGGVQEAAAPLAGPEARAFPLTLVIVGSPATAAGPFDVVVEGRRGGQAVAQGVRTDGAAPVSFSPGKVVHYRFALRSAVAPDSTPTMPPATMPPPMMPPPMMPPPMTPPTMACTPTDTCSEDHKCACAPGCTCAFTCGAGHCVARCDGPGTTCQLDVAGGKMVNLECAGGAACLVSGAPEKGDVHLNCAGGKPLPCGEDVLVCNRSCP